MFDYQKSHRYFAQAPGRMEQLCADELRTLGARDVAPAYRGLYFTADTRTLYTINYTSRLISRVLAPLVSFPSPTAAELTARARRVQWERIFHVDQTFAITASVTSRAFTNSLYAAQCLKDGIADRFRDVTKGRRPSVSTKDPDVRFNLHIEKDVAVVSLDTSGESLHKRGYRLLAGEAPMQETLAAGIIRLTEWDGERPLLDCMCGSGTLLAEALMAYCRIPAQYLRARFGFESLPDHDEALWQRVRTEADARIRPLPASLISGSDMSERTLNAARENLARLPHGDAVALDCRPFQHVRSFSGGVLVTNPPYGIRLGEIDDVQKLYGELGDFIKQRCTGSTAWIYMGDPSLRKSIGLKTSRRIPLVNGKFDGVLVRIDSYEGSRKPYYAALKAQEAAGDE